MVQQRAPGLDDMLIGLCRWGCFSDGDWVEEEELLDGARSGREVDVIIFNSVTPTLLCPTNCPTSVIMLLS